MNFSFHSQLLHVLISKSCYRTWRWWLLKPENQRKRIFRITELKCNYSLLEKLVFILIIKWVRFFSVLGFSIKTFIISLSFSYFYQEKVIVRSSFYLLSHFTVNLGRDIGTQGFPVLTQIDTILCKIMKILWLFSLIAMFLLFYFSLHKRLNIS